MYNLSSLTVFLSFSNFFILPIYQKLLFLSYTISHNLKKVIQFLLYKIKYYFRIYYFYYLHIIKFNNLHTPGSLNHNNPDNNHNNIIILNKIYKFSKHLKRF